MLIIDSHCDTPSQIMRQRDLRLDNNRGHVDFPKLKRGDIGAVFFALYASATLSPDEATKAALEMAAGVFDAVASSDTADMAYSTDDILANRDKGKVSILLGMENGAPIQHSLPLLRLFYRLGVRYMTLTHNGDNEIGDSAAKGSTWNGLSPFGIEVVEEMNSIGMLVDIAHASDKTFFDCIHYSKAPVVSTHSCCRAIAGHSRNMTDEMIRAMADKGGVIQINFYPTFLSDAFARDFAEWEKAHGNADEIEQAYISSPHSDAKKEAWYSLVDSMSELQRPGVEAIVDHIDHAVNVGGIDHVGIGSDFDGIAVTPYGVEDISKTGLVFDEMRRRGYSEDSIEKVAGKNFLRVLKDAELLKTKML